MGKAKDKGEMERERPQNLLDRNVEKILEAIDRQEGPTAADIGRTIELVGRVLEASGSRERLTGKALTDFVKVAAVRRLEEEDIRVALQAAQTIAKSESKSLRDRGNELLHSLYCRALELQALARCADNLPIFQGANHDDLEAMARNALDASQLLSIALWRAEAVEKDVDDLRCVFNELQD
jgi:hypothetical protein